MDQVTQQNAALVEEAAAASESMREQAGHLADVVNAFKLDDAQRVVTPIATAPAKAVTGGMPSSRPQSLTRRSRSDPRRRRRSPRSDRPRNPEKEHCWH
jgi:hypothetical protein